MSQDLETSLAEIAKQLKRQNQFTFSRSLIVGLFLGSVLLYQWFQFQSAPSPTQQSPIMYLSDPSLANLQSLMQRNDLKLIVVSHQNEDEIKALANNPKTLVLITSDPILER